MTDPFRDQLQSAIGAAYVVERELPGGGMSRVFVATETALRREVVIKVLPPELAAGVNRERFRREIQLAAALQHPHIVPLLSAGESGDLLYYTMPYIRGESLRAAIEREGRLPVRDVVRILHDVLDALAYAHEHGVIHRDIKPANVLMSGQHAVITDFGVAKALSASIGPVGVTTSGVVIGSPAYLAPEQLAADPSADHRMDIYAVGLLAYELLSGESPFADRSSPQATMAAQLTEMPRPLEQRVPGVPRPLAALITRCLAKDPAGRPPTARALLAALSALSTPDGDMRGAEPVARRGPPRRVVAALSVVLTVAMVSVVALTLTHRTANAPESPATPAPVVAAATSAPIPAPAQQGAAVLTRADSLAIAEAVQKRLAETPRSAKSAPAASGVPQVSVDSLRAQLQRAFADSIRSELSRARAMRVFRFDSTGNPRLGFAPLPPRMPVNVDSMLSRFNVPGMRVAAPLDSAAMRRVVINGELRSGANEALVTAAHALADSLRVKLGALGFEVVMGAETRGGSDPLRLARAHNAAIGITCLALPSADSISYLLIVGDLRRGQDVRTLTGGRAAATDPLSGVGRFALSVANWLGRRER